VNMNNTKVKEFEREQHRKKMSLITASALLVFTSFLLFVIFGGDTTASLRRALGISYFMSERTGVYADCSKPWNRNNKFCSGEPAYQRRSDKKPDGAPARSWDLPGNSAPFSLSE